MLCVSRWKCFQFSGVERIDLKKARPHEQAKVITYRLIEEHSHFYTPPHFSVGVLCYTFRCLSVCPSVRPCSPFPIDNLSNYSRIFFKFCIHIVIGDEWYGIVNGQNPSIFNRVTALFRIGKMVSGLLFLYCS